MKRILAVLLVALTACVPSASGPAANDSHNYKDGLLPLTLARAGERVEVVLNAGLQDAEEAALTIGGDDLVLLAPLDPTQCALLAGKVECTPPTIPAGKAFIVTVTGTKVRANASWYRPGSLVLIGPVRGLPKP
jgi:hypothetical protein